jgi:hypothetical protein
MSQPTAPAQDAAISSLRQEAYADAVNPSGSQLAYSSLEFNFALNAPMTSRNSLTIGIP